MKLGTNDIGSVYLGTNAVQKVYLGANEVWTSFTGLLDDYPNAAAAYSLRLLRSAYTGSAIRVRRASDNTEQDIGFVDNELDTSALTTFCSGTNGFVKTWYDQSGDAIDLTQTTAANQPQIVSSGSVIQTNGLPSISFNKNVLISSNKSVNQLLSTFAILYPTSDGTTPGRDIFGQFFGSTVPFNIWAVEVYNSFKFSASYSNGTVWNTPKLNAYSNNTQYQITTIYNSSLITQRLNNGSQLTTSRGGSFNNASSPYYIGSWPQELTNNGFIGTIQEVIIYPSIQDSTNISEIENNQLNYY